jgi:hypothetical protein
MPFLSLPLLLLLASPLLASAASNTSTPQVSLLIDSINPLPNNSIASLVSQINDRKLKNGTFYFGSTLASLDLYPETTAWTEERFNDTWNLAVAENDCSASVSMSFGRASGGRPRKMLALTPSLSPAWEP